jgi:hypothetical protein
VDQFVHFSIGFVTLLLFPFLGLLALLKKRAAPWLSTAVLGWLLLGALGLLTHRHFGLARATFYRAWLTGLALGCAFLLVLWLKNRRHIARWLKVSMALLTLTVFIKALLDFLHLYT